jgi:hypothetical protein
MQRDMLRSHKQVCARLKHVLSHVFMHDRPIFTKTRRNDVKSYMLDAYHPKSYMLDARFELANA